MEDISFYKYQIKHVVVEGGVPPLEVNAENVNQIMFDFRRFCLNHKDVQNIMVNGKPCNDLMQFATDLLDGLLRFYIDEMHNGRITQEKTFSTMKTLFEDMDELCPKLGYPSMELAKIILS